MKFLHCVALLLWLTACSGHADEDDMEQRWPSPNGRYVIRHTAAYDHRAINWRKTGDVYDQPAAYTVVRGLKLLWAAESPVDESANSFRCVWGTDSKSAVLLDRPGRGDVEIFLISTVHPRRGAALHLQRMLDREARQTGDDNWRNLQKAWFGQWRFSHGRFEGIVVVVRGYYHCLRVELDPMSKAPRLRLIGRKFSGEWHDNLGEL